MLIVTALLGALEMAFTMFWEILWALGLGFLLSAVVQPAVARQDLVRLLGTDSPRGILFACATFANGIIFEFASTSTAGGRALERRHQPRRCDRLHPCRPDH
jgi:uncharacterized membrane protein YraQ (UPF0718 family)